MDIIHQIIERNQGFTITIAEIVVFTVFISLILYHFLIYLGRKSFAEGKLYLYFSLLLTGFLTFIFLDTNLYFISGSLVLNTKIWTTFFTAISWGVIFFSFLQIIKILLPASEKEHQRVRTGLQFYAVTVCLWLGLVIPSFTPYHQEVFRLMWYVTGALIIFQAWNYLPLYKKAGKTDPEIKLILWGVLGYVVYMWIYRVFLMNYPGKMELWIVNNILKITMAFTFALALARKFNREYADLIALKENLEQKVNEKTHELLYAKEKIEHESRLRTEYFIQVAHETKTPLTLIENYLHRLAKIQGYSHELSVVQENFQSLRDTMILFLDSEKLEKGLLVYAHEQVLDLPRFVKTKVPLYSEWAVKHNLVFLADISGSMAIQCDPVAIERILNNLMDNAIKYTAEGEIHLTLRAEGNYAVLKVQDSGIGIPQSQLPYVFDRFYRGTNAENASGGLGMGLFIVRETLKSLYGSIDVHSQPGRGTTFTVRIPQTEAKAASQIFEADTSGRREFPKTKFEATRKNILLVEDHHDLSAYLLTELNGSYNVFYAVNGKDALELLKTSPIIDVIVSDVMMHGMSGYNFFESLRQHPRYNHTPFIFITARSNHGEKIDYLNKGAVDYIYKPFSIDELQAKIRTILKHTENQRMAGLGQAIQAISNSMEMPTAISPDKWTIFETRKRQYGLTDRQTEVIREVEKGSDYRQIAETLNVSQKTIHRHIQILFKKFGVHNKIDLLKKLFEN